MAESQKPANAGKVCRYYKYICIYASGASVYPRYNRPDDIMWAVWFERDRTNRAPISGTV